MKEKEKLSDSRYMMQCWNCQRGWSVELCLLPFRHRNKVVGLLILCDECYEKLKGEDINTSIAESEEKR